MVICKVGEEYLPKNPSAHYCRFALYFLRQLSGEGVKITNSFINNISLLTHALTSATYYSKLLALHKTCLWMVFRYTKVTHLNTELAHHPSLLQSVR